MKKLFLMFAVAGMISFASCGGEKKENGTQGDEKIEQKAEEAPKAQEAPKAEETPKQDSSAAGEMKKEEAPKTEEPKAEEKK